MNYNIPVIDISRCGLLVAEDDVTDQNFKDVGEELYTALSTIGFAYMTNHGIPWSKVDKMNEVSEEFYSLPLETKMKFGHSGFALSYDHIGRSRANETDLDYYEGFRTSGDAYVDEAILWPDVPKMKDCYIDFADISSKLVIRLLKALGHGMKLKNKDYFCQVHSLMNQSGNDSVMKTLKYPPINGAASENRIGEHTDKTTLSLLFQDQMGGLQVRDLSDKLVDVHPIPGAIVLNVGDVLEAWSGNRLKATSHLVTSPNDPCKKGKIRRSVAYFAEGNRKVLMEKLEFENGAKDYEKDIDVEVMTVEEFMFRSVGKLLKNLN